MTREMFLNKFPKIKGKKMAQMPIGLIIQFLNKIDE